MSQEFRQLLTKRDKLVVQTRDPGHQNDHQDEEYAGEEDFQEFGEWWSGKLTTAGGTVKSHTYQ